MSSTETTTFDRDGPQVQANMSPIQKLPNEIIDMVIVDMLLPEFAPFGQSCKKLNEATIITFCKSYFHTRNIMLEKKSVQTLVAIAEHSVFASSVRKVGFSLCRVRGDWDDNVCLAEPLGFSDLKCLNLTIPGIIEDWDYEKFGFGQLISRLPQLPGLTLRFDAPAVWYDDYTTYDNDLLMVFDPDLRIPRLRQLTLCGFAPSLELLTEILQRHKETLQEVNFESHFFERDYRGNFLFFWTKLIETAYDVPELHLHLEPDKASRESATRNWQPKPHIQAVFKKLVETTHLESKEDKEEMLGMLRDLIPHKDTMYR
ncbi:hypothetical protein IL306_008096 [Fusarium sp. DS 682]|nr:hypothetical protein IL306_008096 [Fusarium sp. DS 682]